MASEELVTEGVKADILETGGENEYYPTPIWCVTGLLKHPAFHISEHIANTNSVFYDILDPCAGDNRILYAMEDFYFTDDKINKEPLIRFLAIDTDPKDKYVVKDSFFLTQVAIHDLAIFNPPFSKAVQFVERARSVAKNVVMLQRLNFLGSVKRHDFWVADEPDAIYVFSKRPSFTGNKKTDSQEYAWFVWNDPNNPISDKGIFHI